MEQRDRGSYRWPQDCYCDKYGPDGIPHPVRNKEERYNHKRRYAQRNVIQANLHLLHEPPNRTPEGLDDMDTSPVDTSDSSDESTSSLARGGVISSQALTQMQTKDTTSTLRQLKDLMHLQRVV